MTDQTPFTRNSSPKPIPAPTILDWIYYYVLNIIHGGFPFLNSLFRFAPKFTPDQMGDKTGQVSCCRRI